MKSIDWRIHDNLSRKYHCIFEDKVVIVWEGFNVKNKKIHMAHYSYNRNNSQTQIWKWENEIKETHFKMNGKIQINDAKAVKTFQSNSQERMNNRDQQWFDEAMLTSFIFLPWWQENTQGDQWKWKRMKRRENENERKIKEKNSIWRNRSLQGGGSEKFIDWLQRSDVGATKSCMH